MAGKRAGMIVQNCGLAYETVAASQTDQVMGGTGAIGDILARLICTVAVASAASVSIKDGGGSSIPIVPATAPIGVYVVHLGLASVAGAWSVTTTANVTVVGIGQFS